MRIAIIDDIAAERELLQKRLETMLPDRRLSAEILCYGDGQSFLAAAERKKFQLVFMDIYMDGPSGMETARQLRSYDKDALLVFTTTSADHALEGFRVRAFDYLVKPYTDEALGALLDEIAALVPAEEKYLDISTAAGPVRLRLSDILFAEHFRHQIYIYTASGKELTTRQTFREFTEKLSDDRFFMCSRGVIVNLEHAKDFDGNTFILNDGRPVSVSRNLARDAQMAFGEFLFRKGNL